MHDRRRLPMDELFRQALELAKAQASVREMSPEDIANFTANMANNLKNIANEAPDDEEPIKLACDPKTAIRERSILCAICGKSFKVLTKKHLALHGITPDEYRKICGYKKGYPLICKGICRERRKNMENMKLWERRKNVNNQPVTD